MKFLTDKITWTDSMKTFTEEQVKSKLCRIVDNVEDIEIKLSKIGPKLIKVAISIDAFRAQATDQEFYIALMDALNNLKGLIIKAAKRKTERTKLIITEDDNSLEDNLPIIAKDKDIKLDELTIYEAIDNFEKTDYQFYAYKDIETNSVISIIYRKLDNTYGVIRCK